MDNPQQETPTPAFTWFHYTADVNDPKCLCSVCLEPITADEDDPEFFMNPDAAPIRLFSGNGYGAVFHHRCVPSGLFETEETS